MCGLKKTAPLRHVTVLYKLISNEIHLHSSCAYDPPDEHGGGLKVQETQQAQETQVQKVRKERPHATYPTKDRDA
ncbi:unnamed protein product [Nippostrongylus brasiliensis]|uniref:Uncharacterized protein n=1 Tax=Nippostrongylus brasiliensis TaxID=27835 RepID=A0A0N4XEG3_NIPBR|nr:unnamed protein product [Nippostrongylus brasiliensis]